MTKTILLTRSKKENLKLRDKLSAHSCKLIDLPLLTLQSNDFNFQKIKDFENIIVTSKFAANLLPANPGNQKVWVVGESSAGILANKGYEIACIAPDAAELTAIISIEQPIKICYICGDHITREMPEFVKKFIVYNAIYKDELSEEEEEQLKNNAVDMIPIYSKNCAKALIKLLVRYDLLNLLANVTIIAISLKVKKVLEEHFSNIIVSEKPNKIFDEIVKYVEGKKSHLKN